MEILKKRLNGFAKLQNKETIELGFVLNTMSVFAITNESILILLRMQNDQQMRRAAHGRVKASGIPA